LWFEYQVESGHQNKVEENWSNGIKEAHFLCFVQAAFCTYTFYTKHVGRDCTLCGKLKEGLQQEGGVVLYVQYKETIRFTA
jgi:hypothetical protein